MTNTANKAKMRVSLVRCPSYEKETLEKALRKSFAILGGLETIVRPGMKVLLKPNVMMPKPYGFAANTHPLFLKAVIELFQKAGAAVTVGESSAGSLAGITFTASALRQSGIEDVAKETGARLVNFDKERAFTKDIRNPLASRIPIAQSVLDADLVVSLPKLKTHTFGNLITGAVKNCYGMVPGQIKAEYHRLAPKPAQFYTIVRDVFGIVRPGLAIFDAVTAMEGDGPSAGAERPLGWIITSRDPVAADAVAAELIHIPSRKVLTTRLCAEAGLGTGDMDGIEVVGESLEHAVVRDFKLPGSTVTNPYLYRFILTMTKTRPVIDPGVCKLCRVCSDSCPAKAMSIKDGRMTIDRAACIRCFCCHEVCPHQAIKPKKKNILGEIFSRIIVSRW